MSITKLLNKTQKEIFNKEYHNFLLAKRNGQTKKELNQFLDELIVNINELKSFTRRQLNNQIIYGRNKEGAEEWPTYQSYKQYISPLSRSFLNKSKNSCLLAVEVYNKPNVNFRTENYILLMMISWTSAFHALFIEKGLKYKYSDEEYYDLIKCIEVYKSSKKNFEVEAISENLIYLYTLRNEIVHRNTAPIDEDIFGECQACLYNLQDFLDYYWKNEFSVLTSLTFSLQFSKSYSASKEKAIKKYGASKIGSLKKFIENYKSNLANTKPDIINSPRFSFKVYLIPKLVNKENHSDIAVEFVKIDSANQDICKNYENLVVAIKDLNERFYRASEVCEEIISHFKDKYNRDISFTPFFHHARCAKYYKIRKGYKTKNPAMTNTEYCRYHQAFKQYESSRAWIEKLKEELTLKKLNHIITNT